MSDGPKFNVPALKRAIVENTGPGRPFTRRSLSLAASGGKNPDLVRDLLSRGQDRKPSFETVSGIARALGINIGRFIDGTEDLEGSDTPIRIKVIGAVEAGAWRMLDQWEESRQYPVDVYPALFPNSSRFGLEMVGFSMDKLFLPGTILDCFAVPATEGLTPMPGDIVIAQRRRGDLIETTCKRLELLPDGSYQLRAESDRPEFAEPIPIGRPDKGMFSDDETTFIGVVNSAVRQMLRR